jgi:hypothetical protein
MAGSGPGGRTRGRGRDRREPIPLGFGDRVVDGGARPVRRVIVSVPLVIVPGVVVPGGRRECSVVGVLVVVVVVVVGKDLDGGTHV